MPIHAILGDGKAGLRRAWAARPLGAIGTAEDLPLLKRLAETDPLTRARSGSPRPVDKMLGSASDILRGSSSLRSSQGDRGHVPSEHSGDDLRGPVWAEG